MSQVTQINIQMLINTLNSTTTWLMLKDREIFLRKSPHTLHKHISYHFIDELYKLIVEHFNTFIEKCLTSTLIEWTLASHLGSWIQCAAVITLLFSCFRRRHRLCEIVWKFCQCCAYLYALSPCHRPCLERKNI